MEITLSIGPDGSAHIVRSSGVAGMPQATELTSLAMTAEELDSGSAPAVDSIDDEAFAGLTVTSEDTVAMDAGESPPM